MPGQDYVELDGSLFRRLFNLMGEKSPDALTSLCRVHQGEDEADTLVLNETEKRLIDDCNTLVSAVRSIRYRYGCSLAPALRAAKKYQMEVQENVAE